MSEIRMKTIHDAVYQVLVDCLRAARQAADTTQVELANRLGTDQSYVSKYERAERRLDIIELRSICMALSIDFTAFVGSFEEQLRKQGLS
jgi:transcriptional regulator with XRE-family HTH domain